VSNRTFYKIETLFLEIRKATIQQQAIKSNSKMSVVIINTLRSKLVELDEECAHFKQRVIERMNDGSSKERIASAFNSYKIFRIKRRNTRKGIKGMEAQSKSQTSLAVGIAQLPEFLVAIIGEYSPIVIRARMAGRRDWLLSKIREMGYTPKRRNTDGMSIVPFCGDYTPKQLRPVFKNYCNRENRDTTKYQAQKMCDRIKLHMSYSTDVPTGDDMFNGVNSFVKSAGYIASQSKSLEGAWAFLMNLKEYNARITAPKVRKSAKK